MTDKGVNIIVTDDHRLFRKGICALLSDFDLVDQVGEAENGRELINLIHSKELVPDLVLLDINMPVMDGLETTRYLKLNHPQIRIIIISMEEDVQLVSHLVEEGVDGYLLKNSDPDELEHAIRMVTKNEFYLSSSLTSSIVKGAGSTSVSDNLTDQSGFSPREIEILQLICEQYTASEIAEKLLISARTVEGLRKKLMDRAKVRNMAGLVVYAIKNKLVRI